MIRDEDGLLTGYVYVDIAGRDPTATSRGRALLRDKIELPAGLRRVLERPVRGHGSGSRSGSPWSSP